MAAILATSHLIDFILVLAPQVGLEPTTLRLTVAPRIRSTFIFRDLRGAERRIWSPFGAKFSQLLSQVCSRFCLLAVEEQAQASGLYPHVNSDGCGGLQRSEFANDSLQSFAGGIALNGGA